VKFNEVFLVVILLILFFSLVGIIFYDVFYGEVEKDSKLEVKDSNNVCEKKQVCYYMSGRGGVLGLPSKLYFDCSTNYLPRDTQIYKEWVCK